jgi:hypothetical protein
MNFEIPAALKKEHEELHKELVPATKCGGRTDEAAKSVAKLLHPHFTKETTEQFDSAEQDAQKNRVAMKSIKLTSPPYDFEKAFRTAEENGVQILLVLSSPLFAPHSKEIADLAMRYRLPTI